MFIMLVCISGNTILKKLWATHEKAWPRFHFWCAGVGARQALLLPTDVLYLWLPASVGKLGSQSRGDFFSTQASKEVWILSAIPSKYIQEEQREK